VVRAVLVEREEGRRRVEPAQRRLSCHGRAADVDGLRGGGGDELRHALEEPHLRALRVRHDFDHHPPVQRRQDRQGRVGHRLPAALLLPHAPGRQRRQPPRRQDPLREAGHRQVALELAGHAPGGLGRREGPPVPAAIPGRRPSWTASGPAGRCR
jgi:hypothetical protein